MTIRTEDTPLVSVIVPCFNLEKLVGEAVKSALAQTYPRVEVIVIDDGSTDGTVDVLRSFNDDIRWETGPNRGACVARNRGLALARGDLVQFLDADDLLHPKKLELQVPECLRHPGTVVFCDGDQVDLETGRHLGVFAREIGDADPVIYMLGGGLITNAPVHHRSALEAVGGFREDLPCAQERDLHLRLACSGLLFHRLPKCLFTHRHRVGSVSGDPCRVLDQHLGIVRGAYEILQQRGTLTDERARHCAGLLASDARQYLRLGRRDEAENYFRAARQLHPSGGLDLAYGRASGLAMGLIGAERLERLAMAGRAVRAPMKRQADLAVDEENSMDVTLDRTEAHLTEEAKLPSAGLRCKAIDALRDLIKPLPVGKKTVVKAALRVLRVRGPFIGTVDGVRMAIDPSDWHEAFNTYVSGASAEQSNVDVVRRSLGPGDTFLDIGANKGVLTALCRQCVGSTGAGLSFEPVPVNARDLRWTVAANGWQNVEVVEKAVSDEVGTAAMELNGFEQGHSSWSHLSDKRSANTVDVVMTTLDQEMAARGISSVALTKIDIEGAELRALQGATTSLRTGALRRILMEIHVGVLGRATTEELLSLLEAHGYAVEYLGDEGKIFERWIARTGEEAPPAGLLPGKRVHAVFTRSA